MSWNNSLENSEHSEEIQVGSNIFSELVRYPSNFSELLRFWQSIQKAAENDKNNNQHNQVKNIAKPTNANNNNSDNGSENNNNHLPKGIKELHIYYYKHWNLYAQFMTYDIRTHIVRKYLHIFIFMDFLMPPSRDCESSVPNYVARKIYVGRRGNYKVDTFLIGRRRFTFLIAQKYPLEVVCPRKIMIGTFNLPFRVRKFLYDNILEIFDLDNDHNHCKFQLIVEHYLYSASRSIPMFMLSYSTINSDWHLTSNTIVSASNQVVRLNTLLPFRRYPLNDEIKRLMPFSRYTDHYCNFIEELCVCMTYIINSCPVLLNPTQFSQLRIASNGYNNWISGFLLDKTCGLGYHFMTKKMGIIFNDSTMLVVSSIDLSQLEYTNVLGRTNRVNFPFDYNYLGLKMKLLLSFKKYMDHNFKVPIVQYSRGQKLPGAPVVCWFQTQHVVAMFISDNKIQFNFLGERFRAIFDLNNNTMTISDQNCPLRRGCYRFRDVAHYGCDTDLLDKIAYLRQKMLDTMQLYTKH
ncbi:serine/threonine-protein kinase PLK1-like [Teleopsis dalmanni]|uniref:serine/threonine-protein kinase PLK1-like n=1 Tax=Teleopsis dalmanni TaxID=139649 RepID=UPI0018CE7D2C|nr:serine/threonine-protein kinase PLK1-like [Teleopsis dalmanni]